MSEQHPNEEKVPTLPEVIWAAARWIAKRELLIRVGAIVLLLLVGGATVVYGQSYLDGGVLKLKAELMNADEITNARVDAIEKKFDVTEERNARRFEVLYNTMLTGRPQPGAEALMTPATKDGGP